MISLINNAVDYLVKFGIKAGQRIAVLSPNSPEYAVITLALWKLQAVVVPISTRLPIASVNQLLNQTGCSNVIVSSDYSNSGFPIPAININDLVTCDKKLLCFPSFDELGFDLNSDASILFTSASSGSPKAVLHTIGNHYYSSLGSNENIPFNGTDCWLMSLPIYHISGFSLITRALVGNASIYFTDESLLHLLENTAITHVSMVPTQLQRLIDANQRPERERVFFNHLRKFKAILLGGAAIPKSLIARSKELSLPVYTTYGSTELASQIATSPSPCISPKVLKYRDVTIGPDSEILVKGKTLFKGYIKKDLAELSLDKDDYFATGDIGRLNQQGELCVTGRKDLMFISGGENIHPEQIERLLNDIENISQAVVVPMDNAEFGKRPVAFLQTTDGKIIDIAEITNSIKQKLESFKVPIAFYSMPKEQANTLKPNRKELASLAREYSLNQKG